ncbi:MAG TPA: ABC transporter substrate-binding protein [Lachnospiraceae bacterium]|nr:ABC transporter substrate-binding protein [Lachnospiraceae bacterium]
MSVMMLTGCGATEGTGAADGSVADGKVYKIGICQLLEHEALDQATQGFKDATIEFFGEGNVEFNFQNAQGEQPNATTICNAFVADKVDLILANATIPLQAAASATATIPILGTSVTDYGAALDISDWIGVSGKNVSGTSDLAPLAEQENMLLELCPDVKTVAIVYCSAEVNSVYQAKKFAEYLTEDGIAYKEYSAADSNEIQTIVTNAVLECDVIYIPTDNTMASSTEAIHNIAFPAGVPIIAGEEGLCKGCGIATLSISYYDIGYATGKMAYEILVNGADISSMEVQYAPKVTKEYNAALCDALGIKVPDDYIAMTVED